MIVLNYGGGRQSIAIITLILRGVLPKPDRIICANTGRENPSTWEYVEEWVGPALKSIDRSVEVIPPKGIYDLWSGTGNTILIPVWLANGKMSSFCSGMWKRDRMDVFLRSTGVSSGIRWIGFAKDEQKRISRLAASTRDPQWAYQFPLAELGIDSATACSLVQSFGWPEPKVSSCFMCPNKKNEEWRDIRERWPDLFAEACEMDDQIRAEDLERGGTGMWLHRSRVPLRDADLTAPDEAKGDRQCSQGVCFI